jgi:hypothetical protein
LAHLSDDDFPLVIGEAAVLGQTDRLAPTVPEQLCSFGHAESIYRRIYTGKRSHALRYRLAQASVDAWLVAKRDSQALVEYSYSE